MRRRDFVLLGASMLVAPTVAEAQRKIPIVGLLATDSVRPPVSVRLLSDALREKGWMPGRDFRIEDRVSLEGYEDYAKNAAGLVQAKVDVIVTVGSTATVAAAKATKQIPIVINAGIDPVASGLAQSLSRPGGNITGLVNSSGVLNAKRIELLKELDPALSRVGLLLSPNVVNPIYRRDSEMAALALNIQVHVSEVRTLKDIEEAIAELVRAKVGAIYISPSSMFTGRSQQIVDVVAKHGLPAVYANGRFADAGGLLIYASSANKSYARVAGYVDRILKGARPADLPIEQASDFELIVNVKTAKTLGIKIPQSILVRADRVIE